MRTTRSRRRLVALVGACALTLVPVVALASPAPVSATTQATGSAAVGPNPWLTMPATSVGIDYAGWATRLAALGRARVASPKYRAARTAAGLDAPPLVTTYAALPSVIDQVGVAPGQHRRLRVTDLPGSFGEYIILPTSPTVFAAVSLTGPGGLSIGAGDGVSVGMASAGANVSGLLPLTSPVLGTGDTTLVVHDQLRGRPVVSWSGSTAATTMDIEVYSFGTQAAGHHAQTLVLDVDGATLDTTPYGGPGVRTLSPLSSFLAAWAIKPTQERALVAATVTLVRQQLTAGGASIKVVSTLAGADPFGAKDVSRVVIGGTRAETGVDAISASADVDPGNLLHEETSLVMLDTLSGPPTPARGDDDPSLNAWLGTGSDRVAFVSRALANVVLHEVGHSFGLYDTWDGNGNRSVMDAGGHAFEQNLYLAGADRIGGTADDPVSRERGLLTGDLVTFGPDPLPPVSLYGGQYYDRIRDLAYWVPAA